MNMKKYIIAVSAAAAVIAGCGKVTVNQEEKPAEACDIRYIGAVRSDGSVGLNSYGKKVLRELKYRIQLYEQQNKEAQK